MHQHNVPQFIALLKERKFPIDGMQMEVIANNTNGTNGFKGIITMESEECFSLSWCRWECFLLLLSALNWKHMLNYLLPYCCGMLKMPQHPVDSDMGRELNVIRSIKYK